MIQIIAALVIATGASGFFLFQQWRANGALTEQIKTITQERDDAKAEAETAAAATREHAAKLAAVGAQSRRDAVAVRKAGGDCLDRVHGPDIGDVLRGVRAADQDGPPKPAAPG